MLRVVAVGDVGRFTDTRLRVAAAVRRVCAARGCDLGLLLGDNLYDRGMNGPDDARLDAILAPFLDAGPEWLVVHGNHDHGATVDDRRTAWARQRLSHLDHAHQPAPWYAVRAGPAELFALDTTAAFWRGAGPQLDWLSEGLATSGARWRVVFGHHTFRSNGRHGNAGAYEGWVNVPFASGRALQRLFERGLCPAADLYLSGHDHALQLLAHCGVTLVVSGAGSTTTPLEGHGNRAAFQRAVPGFAHVELGEVARVRFFDDEGALLYESRPIRRPSP